MKTEMWQGRSKKLLSAVAEKLEGDSERLTAGWVLGLLHKEGGMDEHHHNQLMRLVAELPGYDVVDANRGRYHYETVRQLEHLCASARIVVAAS